MRQRQSGLKKRQMRSMNNNNNNNNRNKKKIYIYKYTELDSHIQYIQSYKIQGNKMRRNNCRQYCIRLNPDKYAS